MPTSPASYDTSQDYIPIIPRSRVYKMGGLPLLCPNNATLSQWRTKEQHNIAIGSPLWPAGQLIRVLTDADGIWRKWDGFGSFTTITGSGTVVLPSREAVSLTTDSIVYLESGIGTVVLGKSFYLTSVSADKPCRVRLYSTSAARTADSARVPGVFPTGEHGLICDLVFTSDNLLLNLAPTVMGSCQEDTVTASIPYSVTNYSQDSAITIVFTGFATEV